jgi:hypothetical protein
MMPVDLAQVATADHGAVATHGPVERVAGVHVGDLGRHDLLDRFRIREWRPVPEPHGRGVAHDGEQGGRIGGHERP